ncbi:MAG: CRISPR-associated endonuclease Cas6 [Microscillaceae bacterium]|nr:CRISPR-associated endonuclease Cas6 [Microscillaceae bacterium]
MSRAIQHLFDVPHWSIDLKGKQRELRIQRVDMSAFHLRLDPEPCTYQIRDWIALSQKNFGDYLQKKGITAKVQFLENILKGNILSFAKDLGWWIEQPVEVCLLDWNEPRVISYKGNKLLSFDFRFESNVALPNHIVLGKKVSLGYGVVRGE